MHPSSWAEVTKQCRKQLNITYNRDDDNDNNEEEEEEKLEEEDNEDGDGGDGLWCSLSMISLPDL